MAAKTAERVPGLEVRLPTKPRSRLRRFAVDGSSTSPAAHFTNCQGFGRTCIISSVELTSIMVTYLEQSQQLTRVNSTLAVVLFALEGRTFGRRVGAAGCAMVNLLQRRSTTLYITEFRFCF